MKRSVSITLLLAMIFSVCVSSVSVFAQETGNSAASQPSVEDYLSFDCTYDNESKIVVVNGSMKYEAFAHYRNAKLLIYAIPPGMSEYQVAKDKNAEPLAETDVSIGFGFTFKLNKFIDRYSRYAIFLRSEDGILTLATEAQYPETASSVSRDKERKYFKGFSSSLATVAADADVGTVVLPVSLDTLFTENTSGYTYTVDGEQIFFDRSYIDKLDARINSLSLSEPRIYLQFLFSNKDILPEDKKETVEYCMPDLHNEHTLKQIHAATDFLISRYERESGAGIHGIVMGKGWNEPTTYNYYKYESFEEYVELCGLYTVVTANAARSVKPSVDVVVPLTDGNFKSEDAKLTLESFTEALLDYLDNSFASGIDCSFMMESEEVPFGITNDSIDGGVDLGYDGYVSNIYAGGQKAFSNYLKDIFERYKSAPQEYMFCWSVPQELYGTALAASYAYSYYALLSDTAVSSFVMKIDEDEQAKDILDSLKYIDTDKGSAKTKDLLKYFGASAWNEIKGITKKPVENDKSIYTAQPFAALPSSCKGGFDYFDFSDSISINGWNKGTGCSNIRLDYTQTAERAFKAELTLSSVESSELIYLYENYENMSYTPYLKLEMQINDGAEDSLYEIVFSTGNGGDRFESAFVIKGDELNEIVLDMSQYKYSKDIRNIKISVRALHGDMDSCTLWLYNISGYSEKYDSEAIEKLIEKERGKTDQSDEEEKTETPVEAVTIAIGLLLITGALGFGLFVAFKRNKTDEE